MANIIENLLVRAVDEKNFKCFTGLPTPSKEKF
jgi:hypothetical protein